MQKIFKKTTAFLILVFFLYLAIGFFFAPQVLKNIVTEQAKSLTGLDLSFDAISFNPLSFSIEIIDVETTDQNKQKFLTVKSIRANFEPTQLLFGQYNLSHVHLIEPKLNAALDSDFNLTSPHISPKLKHESQQDSQQEKGNKKQHNAIDLLIEEIAISNGSVSIKSKAMNEDIELNKLTFKLNHFNLSDLASDFKLNISTAKHEQIILKGSYNHKQQLLTSQFTINGAQSSTLSSFLPTELGITLPNGIVDSEGSVKWSLALLPVVDISLLEWSGISASWAENIATQDLAIRSKGIQIDLNKQHITAQSLATEKGSVTIKWPWQNESTQQLIEPEDKPNDSTTKWHYQFEHITVDNTPIVLSDNTLSTEVKLAIETAAIHNFSNNNTTAIFSLLLNNNSGGEVSLKGQIKNPLQIQVTAHIKALNLQPFDPWFLHLTGFQLTKGELDAQQSFSLNEHNEQNKQDWQSGYSWQSQGQFSLTNAQLISTTQQELITIGKFNVADSYISSADKQVVLNQIILDHAHGILPLPESTTIKDYKDNNTDNEWRIIFGKQESQQH